MKIHTILQKLIISLVVITLVQIPILKKTNSQDSFVTYEAEAAYKSGWADITTNSGASGGAVMSHIGGKDIDVGSVTFTVEVPSDGEYITEIAYVMKKEKSLILKEKSSYFYVSINGKTGRRFDIKVGTTAQSVYDKATMNMNLKKGRNTVRIYSTKGIVDNIDYRIGIDCLRVRTDAQLHVGMYEDKDATLRGDARYRTAYGAKDSSVAANLGVGSSIDFIVDVEKTGTYNINIWYSSADYRALDIYVDGQKKYHIFCPITGETDRIETVTASLDLDMGKHTISFTNDASIAPDIDKIQVTLQGNIKQDAAVQMGVERFGNTLGHINYNMEKGTADYYSGDTCRVREFEAVVKIEGEINSVVKSSDYESRSVVSKNVQDGHGTGTEYTVISSRDGLPTMHQSFFVYENKPYILNKVSLVSTDGKNISTNFMSPISTNSDSAVNIGEVMDARSIFIPFTNDDWVRYDAQPLKGSNTSYWATALYDTVTRNAVVAGSVEHDTWKTGTSTWATNTGEINFFGVFAGIWSEKYTFDVLPHGSIDGQKVESPKMFLGYFDDWRDGMEVYGEANSNQVSKLNWGSGTPFGYNSWYAQGSSVDFDGSVYASDFINSLSDFKGTDNVAWINLDSFWDNMNESQLKEFVRHCKANGQKAGIYWARYVNWGAYDSRDTLKDEYGNAVTLAKKNSDGSQITDSLPYDPTSQRMQDEAQYYMQKFEEWGFEFLKVDFMNYSALEGHFENPEVKTGMQAYNMACSQLAKWVDTDKFFISYSIAPAMPYQFAHARRISCDVFAGIDQTEYMLNSLTYSWWMDNTIYSYTDPDHIVLSGDLNASRSRYTAAAISGTLMLLSNNYQDEATKAVTERVTSNTQINDIARLGRAFRPVEGDTLPGRAADIFTLQTEDTYYIAVFNYSNETKNKVIDFSRLGLSKDKAYTLKELWTGDVSENKGHKNIELAPQDCAVYKIEIDSSKEICDVENFEKDNLIDDIKSKQNGWSYGGSGDGESSIDLNIFENGSGSPKALRYASTNYYKEHHLTLDLKQHGMKSQSELGAENASEMVENYLSDDIKLSFLAKFENQGVDTNVGNTHESYIKINNQSGDTLCKIGTYNYTTDTGERRSELSLNALNEDKTRLVRHKIKDIDNSGGNKQWHTFEIEFSHEKNAYRLVVDGTAFETKAHGEWISVPNTDGNGMGDIGMVKTLEFGFSWSGWWHCLYVDDIEISRQNNVISLEPVNGEIEYGSDNEFRLSVKNGIGGDVYAGVYQNGVLYDVWTAQQIDSEMLDETITLSIPNDANGVEVKAFVWERSMRPLVPTYLVK